MRVSWQRLSQLLSTGLFGLASLSSLFWVSAAQAKTDFSLALPALKSIQFRPTNVPPPRRGTLRTPYGTGSRGDCPVDADLPALSQLVGNVGLDKTVSDRPSFWVYTPYTQADVSDGTFLLQTGDIEVYQQKVQLPETPGIVEILLPETIAPLAVGQSYRWYFEVTCPHSNPTEAAAPATVTGVVERVVPSGSLASELATAQSVLERAAAYAENGVWYDTLATLAQMRRNAPEDTELTEIWQAMLRDPVVGLADWSDVPIIGDVADLDIHQQPLSPELN